MLDETRLDFLLEAYIDQTLTADGKVELEMLLMASEQARQYFWGRLHLHAAAREWAFRSSAETMVAVKPTKARVLKFPGLRWVAGIAAALVLSGGLYFSLTKRSEVAVEDPAKPVALLALSVNAVWEGMVPAVGSPMDAGPLKLTRGTARIDFLNGAQMMVSSPAELVLVSAMKVELKSGAVRVFAPPAAAGFTVEGREWIAVDRGTEFGMEQLPGKASSLHVFAGRVDVAAVDKPEIFHEVKAGRAVRGGSGGLVFYDADPGLFPVAGDLAGEMRDEQTKRHTEWEEKSSGFAKRTGLVIHYTFGVPGSGPENQVPNGAVLGPSDTNATLVGAERVAGRWPGKKAVSFSRSTDRLRLVAPGIYKDLTLMAWVRVDRLQQGFSVLLRADEVVVGTPHWQFDAAGRLRFGFQAGTKDFTKPESDERTDWDVAISPPLLDGKLGQWVHVVTVYDSKRKVVEHFMDGRRAGTHPLKNPVPLVIGRAQIGNSGGEGSGQLNLVGRIDEFSLLEVALGADEISRLYEAGKP